MKKIQNICLTFAGVALLLNAKGLQAQDSLITENSSSEVKKEEVVKPARKVGSNISIKSFGKGIKFTAEDSTFQLTLHGRIQTLFMYEQVLDGSYATTNFLTRRARLKMNGFAFSPNIQYKMELGLTNRDWGKPITETGDAPSMILDAYVEWEALENLSFVFGQTKLPGNRERVISSQQLQFVDRSLVNAEYNIDRDAGIQIHHNFEAGKMAIREMASISSGEGRNITVTNKGGFDYTGRVELLPMGDFTNKGDYFGSDLEREKSPKLSVGVTYDYNDDASRSGGQLGSFLGGKTDLTSVMVDLMFKYKGLSIMSEYVDKQAVSPVVKDAAGLTTGAFYVGTGISAQMGYLFKNNIELACRYTNVSPLVVTGYANTTQYTFGVSKYVKGHNLKVQSDVSLTEEAGAPEPGLMYRFQVEMAF